MNIFNIRNLPAIMTLTLCIQKSSGFHVLGCQRVKGQHKRPNTWSYLLWLLMRFGSTICPGSSSLTTILSHSCSTGSNESLRTQAVKCSSRCLIHIEVKGVARHLAAYTSEADLLCDSLQPNTVELGSVLSHRPPLPIQYNYL